MDTTMSKMIMKDDQEFNIWFVKEIEKVSCLYNCTDPNYTNRQKQDEGWQKIANSAKVGAIECKERWKNLRACFTRHLKHKFLEAKSGIKYKKPYYLAEHMSFILPYTKLRSRSQEDMKYYGEVVKQQQQKQQQQQQQPQIDNNIVYVDTTESNNENEHSPPYDYEIETEAEVDLMYADNTMYSSNGDQLPPHSDDSPSNHDNNLYLEDTKSAISIFKRRRHNDEEEDADLLFLKSLLPDMKSMNESQKRKFKIGVLKLSDDILSAL